MKKLYTLLDNNNIVLNAQFFNEGEQPKNAIPELVSENFIKPKFDFKTRLFFEAATQEELDNILVPEMVSAMKFRIILIKNGINIQDVYNIIDSLPSPNNDLAYQMFEYAVTFERSNEMLNQLAELMGVTQKELDVYFRQANDLII